MENSLEDKEPTVKPDTEVASKKRNFILEVLTGLSDRYWIFIGLEGHGAQLSEHLQKKRVHFHVVMIVTLAVAACAGWLLKGCSDSDHEQRLSDTIANQNATIQSLQTRSPISINTNASSPPAQLNPNPATSAPPPVIYQSNNGNSANVANSPNANVSQSIINQGPPPEISTSPISLNVLDSYNGHSVYASKFSVLIKNPGNLPDKFNIKAKKMVNAVANMTSGGMTIGAETFPEREYEVTVLTIVPLNESEVSISLDNNAP